MLVLLIILMVAAPLATVDIAVVVGDRRVDWCTAAACRRLEKSFCDLLAVPSTWKEE
jgi:hypothetical protein